MIESICSERSSVNLIETANRLTLMFSGNRDGFGSDLTLIHNACDEHTGYIGNSVGYFFQDRMVYRSVFQFCRIHLSIILSLREYCES